MSEEPTDPQTYAEYAGYESPGLSVSMPGTKTNKNPEWLVPQKPGPVLMGIVQLAESQEATPMRKRPRPDRIASHPARLPGRPRRRLEPPPGLPQGRHRAHHLLPLEGPPGEPDRIKIYHIITRLMSREIRGRPGFGFSLAMTMNWLTRRKLIDQSEPRLALPG